MATKTMHKTILYISISLLLWACNIPRITVRKENKTLPTTYLNITDTVNIAKLNWKNYFSDSNLNALIDTALKNNQELNIMWQEIEISKNEIRARKGEYLPFVGLFGGAGIDKEGSYTWRKAVEENLDIKNNAKTLESNSDFTIGAAASWELDVWKKLRNSKKAAVSRYFSSIEGKNFMVTNLISEIASSYFELMGLDNMLDIIEKNIVLQSNALKVVKEQKNAAKVTQLAVNRFEAQLLNTQNLQFEIKQQIVETENRINFLTGRSPQPLARNSSTFFDIVADSVQAGIPSQLLANRPDIKQAEMELAASKLDVSVAKANFYPSFRITAGIGLQAFNPVYLINPKSIIYNLAGDLVAPLVNRNAIKATYYNANAKQLQAIYKYEQAILNAHIDVLNHLSKINNYSKSFNTKSQEVNILVQSVTIANNLFYSARADYAEVLLTQREALESKMELIEIKMKQMNAKVNIYRALGGGWR
jgi:NodT family efflux transporter outer membrane factor (OMF) lipoprotein